MKLKNILIISFSLFSFSAMASSHRDSIGVENQGGKKIILHKVEAKETYFSLSRRYSVYHKDIMEYNNNVALSIGAIIKIPTNISFSAERSKIVNNVNNTLNKQQPASSSSKRETTHVVQRGETLYAIASKYNMRVDDLKLLNNLTANALNVGQTLKVLSNESVSLTPEVVKNSAGKPEIVPDRTKVSKPVVDTSKIKYVDSTASNTVVNIPKNRWGITEKNEKGAAVWIDDENLDNSKSYALHSLAPIGTIIKVSNPMTNRSTFAKVVGKYTENEATKDVIVVINKTVAEALGALDKRFLVNITYGMPNEN